MRAALFPSAVAAEFIAWMVCFAVFRIVERRLYRRYPGIRTVCRMVYLATAVVVVAPALWVLATALRDVRLLGLVNHIFGMGVFLQTSLRSLLILKWLAWGGPQVAGAAGNIPMLGLRTETELLGFLMALSAAMRPDTASKIARKSRRPHHHQAILAGKYSATSSS
jgi:hypothetical protein